MLSPKHRTFQYQQNKNLDEEEPNKNITEKNGLYPDSKIMRSQQVTIISGKLNFLINFLRALLLYINKN